MSKVKIERLGSEITIDSSTLAEHLALGWTVKQVVNDLANAEITIGAEDTDVINVAVQLQDGDGAALAESMSLQAYLSDTTDGLAITGAAPSGHVAVGTEGSCIHLVTDKVFILNANAAGLLDLDITEAGAATWYLALVFPNGERVVSDAITFAA